LCDTQGIELDDDSNSREFNIRLYAPPRKLFGCTGTHSLAAHQYKGFGAAAVREFWQAIAADINYGLESCDDPECDVCNEP
jgi:hypothetical protein